MALLPYDQIEELIGWISSPEGEQAIAESERSSTPWPQGRLTEWRSTNQDGSTIEIPDEAMTGMKLP